MVSSSRNNDGKHSKIGVCLESVTFLSRVFFSFAPLCVLTDLNITQLWITFVVLLSIRFNCVKWLNWLNNRFPFFLSDIVYLPQPIVMCSHFVSWNQVIRSAEENFLSTAQVQAINNYWLLVERRKAKSYRGYFW